MKNFIKEGWLAAVVLLTIAAAGYGAMLLLIKLGGY